MDATTKRPRPLLRALPLRYVLTLYLREVGTASVSELVIALERDGYEVAGRPSKVVSDALRWEIGKGRVIRVGRGRYQTGTIPRSTLGWIQRRVQRLDER